ncbi:MAG: GNAT family N-acetyltransferase [bacterium]
MENKNKFENKVIYPEIQEPSIIYKDSYLSALEEFHKEGRNLDIDEKEIENSFSEFVQKLKEQSLGLNLKPGYVPATTYWITDKEDYIGKIQIRHSLTDTLLKIGGHIGYEIRPSKRKQGYGENALQLVLPQAKAMGLGKVLLTCDSTNIGSKKIIEANGGVLENEVETEEGHPSKLRYWIQL